MTDRTDVLLLDVRWLAHPTSPRLSPRSRHAGVRPLRAAGASSSGRSRVRSPGRRCRSRTPAGDEAATPVSTAPTPFSPATRTRPGVPAADPDGRVVSTGFAALDAVLGTGGLPRSATVALRGDASSGKTTVALRVAAEAQAGGAIVAWLDLARAFDPVEAVARGVSPEWLVVLTPEDLEEALVLAGSLLAARTVDLLVLDLPDGRDPAVAGTAGGGPAGPACGAGQARRDAARRAGAGRAGPDARRGRGGGERPAAGAAAIGLDPPRAGRRRAAQRGHRRA